MTKTFIDYYMRLHSLKYSLLYVASSVKGKGEYSETNSLYVCECVYMCEGETSFYFMQRNMSELYVIFMTEVSFFNSWPISLEMSFRIKYVVRVIHCCPRTRTRYTHTHTYVLRAFVDLTKNELATGIYVREISRKSDRSLCRLKVANPWRTLHNGAQVGSRAIKNGPPRFRA